MVPHRRTQENRVNHVMKKIVTHRWVKVSLLVMVGVTTVGCCFNPFAPYGREHGGYQGGGEHHHRGERGR